MRVSKMDTEQFKDCLGKAVSLAEHPGYEGEIGQLGFIVGININAGTIQIGWCGAADLPGYIPYTLYEGVEIIDDATFDEVGTADAKPVVAAAEPIQIKET